MAGWIIPGLEGVLEAGSGKILALEPSRVHIKGPSKTKTQDNITTSPREAKAVIYPGAFVDSGCSDHGQR